MIENTRKRLIVLSSPSGGGKSTVARHLMNTFKNISFSISATTRTIREGEENGRHYHFLSKDEFLVKIQNNELVEYEEIFGNYYGTLKSEIESAFNGDMLLLFDVDVKGAVSLNNAYPKDCLLIFIAPPSLDVLEQRLRNRKTETEEQIGKRLARAKLEIEYQQKFHFTVINDNLQKALSEVEKIVRENSAVA